VSAAICRPVRVRTGTGFTKPEGPRSDESPSPHFGGPGPPISRGVGAVNTPNEDTRRVAGLHRRLLFRDTTLGTVQPVAALTTEVHSFDLPRRMVEL
jgi:hypothetical protein